MRGTCSGQQSIKGLVVNAFSFAGHVFFIITAQLHCSIPKPVIRQYTNQWSRLYFNKTLQNQMAHELRISVSFLQFCNSSRILRHDSGFPIHQKEHLTDLNRAFSFLLSKQIWGKCIPIDGLDLSAAPSWLACSSSLCVSFCPRSLCWRKQWSLI